MKFNFMISKWPDKQEEADILRTIEKYDSDYAQLMANDSDNFDAGINWRMISSSGAYYLLSPEVAEEKVRSLVFEVIQKGWCGCFFDPEEKTKDAIYYSTRDDGVQISPRLMEFMCAANGNADFPRHGDFKNGQEVAQAIKQFLPQPLQI